MAYEKVARLQFAHKTHPNATVRDDLHKGIFIKGDPDLNPNTNSHPLYINSIQYSFKYVAERDYENFGEDSAILFIKKVMSGLLIVPFKTLSKPQTIIFR